VIRPAIRIETRTETRIEIVSDTETRVRQVPVEKFITVEHDHSHDSGDNRDSASDVETVLSRSSVSSVRTHSHGTSDSSVDEYSGITSDGDDHVRGTDPTPFELNISNLNNGFNNGSPVHDAFSSASDTDSLTDHDHDRFSEVSDDNSGISFNGAGSNDGSADGSTFEHSHDSLTSVSGISGDSSDDEHLHYLTYTVMEDEEYEVRVEREVEVEFQVDYEVETETETIVSTTEEY
jgi:hypothetical protein